MKPVLVGIVLALISSLAVSGGESRAADNENGSATAIVVAPSVSGVVVDGDDNKFREDWWVEDGIKGGLESFTLRRDLGGGMTIEAQGRAIVPEEDYLIDLRVDKRDIGYMRAGYQEFRKYFDDTGGFFTSFTDSSFDLGKDMHLDIGRIFIEAGLILPDKPKVIIGYEHRFKEGKKSLLEWGRVDEGSFARNIFPAYKDIDEKVDVVRLEVSHDIANVHLGDEFRYENYRTDTRRFEEEFDADTDSTSKTVTVDEDYEHDAFYNTLHVSTHLNDKTFLSMGYLYSSLEGDASFSMTTLPGTGSHDKAWSSDVIDIDQDVHIVNVNAIFGPFHETTIYLGLQGELLEKEGDMDGDIEEPPGTSNLATISSEQDKGSVEETLGVRYAGLPRTTLYAEGRWTQQDIDLTELEVENGDLELDRDTDTDVRRQRYSIGFNNSPLPKTTIAARYRFKYRSNDYDHRVDQDAGGKIAGYSAYILDQDIKTHEVMAKVSFRPLPRLRTSLQYQLVLMDIDTNEDTAPASTDLQTTDYDASIYTVSVTATPLAGLFITGLVSYQDVELTTVSFADAPVVSYDGDVLTLAASAGMAIDSRTNLNVQYSYSMADNFEDISADGLPLGVENQRHAVLANLNRQITDNLSVLLRYGFYNYDDEASDGEDNYTAHMVGATCRLIF
jgi:hypothetical protein